MTEVLIAEFNVNVSTVCKVKLFFIELKSWLQGFNISLAYSYELKNTIASLFFIRLNSIDPNNVEVSLAYCNEFINTIIKQDNIVFV